MLRRALANFDKVAAGMLEEGPIDLGDNREVVMVEKEEDFIRPSKAMKVLREDFRLNPTEADMALRITKGGIESAMKSRAPSGKGAAFMRDAMKKLIEAGAVEKKTKRAKQVRSKELEK